MKWSTSKDDTNKIFDNLEQFEDTPPNLRLYENELTFCMIKLEVLCGILQKIQHFLPSILFHQSDEHTQFQSFEEQVHFINSNCK